MRTKDDILKILDLLEENIADKFEAQDLDFKEWIQEGNINDNINLRQTGGRFDKQGDGSLFDNYFEMKESRKVPIVKQRTVPLFVQFVWLMVEEGL